MSVIFLLIPLSVVIAAGFLAAFIWAVRSGQYEDICTPSMRLLLNDPVRQGPEKAPAPAEANSEPARNGKCESGRAAPSAGSSFSAKKSNP